MPATASMDATPHTKSVTLRGSKYTLRELTIGEYDECVSKATDTKTNALGEESSDVDRTRLLRLMVSKSSGLALSEISKLAMPVVLKLNTLVNDMHYLDEKTDEDEAVEEGEPGKG